MPFFPGPISMALKIMGFINKIASRIRNSLDKILSYFVPTGPRLFGEPSAKLPAAFGVRSPGRLKTDQYANFLRSSLSDGGRKGLPLERSDRELIEESLSGSLQAFDELMVRYQKLVYKIALGYGWGREHALDISQNVFLKVYENLGSLRASDRFKTWLTRITYHESLNWIRKHRKHLNYEQVDDCILISSAGDQEGELLGKESRTMLVKSLFHLSRKQRLVVILRYFNGMSIEEIASVLKCSEGLVKNILFRSVRRLRENLDRHSSGIFNETVHRIRTVC